MIDVVLRKIFGTKHERDVKRIMPTVVASNAFEPSVRALGDAELQAKTDEFRKRLEAGVVLDEGKIAEMATGEGKTLVATLPAYLNGLTGRGVHIVTVNDYLAKRDA